MTRTDDEEAVDQVVSGLFRTLLNNMTEGVNLAEADGTIVYTNRAEDEMFGYGAGELIGQHFNVLNAYGTDEQEQVFQKVRTALDAVGSWRGEWRNRRKDGSLFTSTARVRAVETGDRRFWLCVRDDSTEREKAAAALRESEARLNLAIDAGRMAVWEIDLASSEITGSRELYRLLGFSDDAQPSSEEIRSRYYPGEQERLQAQGRLAMERGDRFIESEFRYVWPDGSVRWLLLRAEIENDDVGHPVRGLGVLMDITTHKQGEVSLQQLNEHLESEVAKKTADRDRIWQLSTDLMLVSDLQGKIISINPAWTALLGWEEQDLLGRSFMELVHPDDQDITLGELSRLGKGETTFRFENRYLRKDGSHLHLSWSAVPAEQHLHAVGRDITAEKEQAEVLRKTESALRQSQKMDAIGSLTGGVAHDFNNLLQVISGNLQLLRKHVAGDEKAEYRLTNALAGVSRGAKLSSQLLAFGRRQPLEPKVINVGRLVRGLDDMLRRTLGETIEIESLVSGGLWNTLVDPGQIENALLNLAINARDAMEDGGKLTIEVGNAFLDDNYARQHADVTAGQYVVLSVSDTGTGIDADVLEKVFEPFYSTKPEGKGTGLGLSMVYGFVKQSSGHIKIYSEVGHGTAVKIYMPRAMDAEDVVTVVENGPITGGSETVLVAEDDEEVRETVVAMLTELGYRVLKAKDAASALMVVESGIPIDLLFTDVVMPGPLKSPELARKAQERLPNLAVLFTSGYTENSIVHGGRLDAGVDLLSKPYTREELARKVRHVLANNAQRNGNFPSKVPVPLNSAPLADTGSRKLTVLFVEDDALIRLNTAEMLQDLGHTVIEAGSAEEAQASLELSAVDVILTDLELPGASGVEFATQVRQVRPELPIVFATGADHAPERLTGKRTFLLRKPYDENSVADILSAALSEPDAEPPGQ